MTLYLFKYCLPMLLGYTLFVGLSGRMNPLVKPEYPEERPSWFLGLWTGMSVSIVMVVGLHMAYSMSLEGVRQLLPPSALFMAVLLIPGFLGYFYYRRIINTELQASRALRSSRTMLKAAATVNPTRLDDHLPVFASYAKDTAQQTPDSFHNAQDNMRPIDTNAPVVADFLDSTDLRILDTHQQDAANHDSALCYPGYMAASDPALNDDLDDTIFEELHYSALDLDEESIEESRVDLIAFNDVPQMSLPEALSVAEEACKEELTFEPETLAADEEMHYLFEPETLSVDEDNNAWFELDDLIDSEQSAELLEAGSTGQMEAFTDNASFLSELELLASDLHAVDDGSGRTRDEELTLIDHNDAQATSSSTLEAALSDERSAHQETARQLYATRNVLATLTSGTEGVESEQTASFLQMKDELSQSRIQKEALETLVQQEISTRLELDSTIAELQGNLILSKQDVRRSTAARAKALSTANKAIAFARQTLQVRALLEEELGQVRETLTRRQSTISSLINELEHEKERTQEEVSFMVQQLVLHEQQLKARRNLEVANDSVASTLPLQTPKRIETQSLSPDL